MARVILAMVISLLMVGRVFAAPDAIVFDGGDIRIKQGSGGALVFQDNTVQTTATLQGPQGPAGPQGATGPQGAQGPAGVANGISKGVHGTIVGSSMSSTGTGFSVARTTSINVGSYDITFSSAFSGTPDCVISPVGHANYSNAPIDCQWSLVSTTGVRVECKAYQPYTPPFLIDNTFTFICVY